MWTSEYSHSNGEAHIKFLTYEKEQIKQGNPISLKMKEPGGEVGVETWMESIFKKKSKNKKQLKKRSSFKMSILVAFLEHL